MSRRLLLATRSAGKLRELRPLFAREGFEVVDVADVGVPESPEEEGLERFDSFEENALAKARYFHARTGLPTVADDSGLEVAALGGAPGVRSKRWSGHPELSGAALDAANNAHLMIAMRGRTERSARYVCVAAYVDGAVELAERGEVRGRLLEAPRGSHGFGYDPYFLSDELGRTFAEATLEEKESVSHRGRAFRRLLAALAARGARG